VAGDYLPSLRRRHWIPSIVCLGRHVDQAVLSTSSKWPRGGLDSQSWDSRHAVSSCEVNGQLPVCITSISRLMRVHSRAVALLQQQTCWVYYICTSGECDQALPWIKSLGLISRLAVYDCNSLVCAVGPWVAAAGGRVSVLINWSSSDVTRGADALEDALILSPGVQCSRGCLCQRSVMTNICYCKCLHCQLHHPTSLCRHSVNARDVNIEAVFCLTTF